jgi:hypothetical protein
VKIIGILRRVTIFAAVAAFISILSYGSGAEIAVRYVSPRLGAWWNDHEFQIAIYSASVLGMAVAIRCAARLIGDDRLKRDASVVATIASALGIAWIAPFAGRLARVASGVPAVMPSAWIVSRAGMDVGTVIDKIATAGIYFSKAVGFSFLAGLAVFGVAVGALMASSSSCITAEPERIAR